MPVRVPITRPMLGDGEVEAVTRVVRSGWLTQGPEVAALESEFARAVGALHAVAVSSCTVALELALRCLHVGRGDDVVTVSHSFIATANCITALGARPVFADIEHDTYGMDPASLERAITPATKAILCVHQLGIPCDLERILAIAAERHLPVVEDAACAIGSEVRIGEGWERIGRPHGVLACFSFHPRKVITTGDGGMITTASAEHAARLRLLRQHAMSVPDTIRHHSDQVVFESYLEPAFNYRMTDVQAAVGRPQLARLESLIAQRRQLADRYRVVLGSHRVLAPPRERDHARCNWQSYPATMRPDAGMSQRDVMQFLMDSGVACKRGVSNAHQEPAYANQSNWACGPDPCEHGSGSGNCPRLAVSERMRDTTVLIPLFHGMTEQEFEIVIAALKALERKDR